MDNMKIFMRPPFICNILLLTVVCNLFYFLLQFIILHNTLYELAISSPGFKMSYFLKSVCFLM